MPQGVDEGGWTPLQFLFGTWIGEGGGDPGQGTGSFSFTPDLQGQIVVRTNRAEYPASSSRPAYRHDDLMIIYRDPPTNQLRAIYFDTEGHVIHYLLQVGATSPAIQFRSEDTPGSPSFRLTYTPAGPETVQLLFEIAPPGSPPAFAPYIEATARRAVSTP